MAIGTKNKIAARIHKLIEEVPLCADAAIHRGPRTVAMLKRRTSQKPISRHNCVRGSAEPFAWFKGSHPARGLAHPACGNCGGMGPENLQTLSKRKTPSLYLLAGKQCYRQVFAPDTYRV